jgi:hypothetical protein
MRSMSATLIALAIAAAPLGVPAFAEDAANSDKSDALLGGPPQQAPRSESRKADRSDGAYSKDEIVVEVENWFGVSAKTAADIVAKAFADLGRPNGYIKGGEGAGAAGVGLRYGEGTLVLHNGGTRRVYWQGPSIGFDAGGNASRVFTLVYGLKNPNRIYDRYPGVEGSAYYVAGVGVNYQQREFATLVPMRAGVGLRLGANVGYLKYSRQRDILPF